MACTSQNISISAHLNSGLKQKLYISLSPKKEIIPILKHHILAKQAYRAYTYRFFFLKTRRKIWSIPTHRVDKETTETPVVTSSYDMWPSGNCFPSLDSLSVSLFNFLKTWVKGTCSKEHVISNSKSPIGLRFTLCRWLVPFIQFITKKESPETCKLVRFWAFAHFNKSFKAWNSAKLLDPGSKPALKLMKWESKQQISSTSKIRNTLPSSKPQEESDQSAILPPA